MWQVQDDQLVDHLWHVEGKLPGHGTSPVMPDNRCFFFTEMPDNGGNIRYQILHVIVFVTLGFVTQVIAALIDGYYLVVVLQAFHLVTPAVPEIWEPMNHHNQWAFTNRGIVNLYAVAVGIAMFYFVPEFGIDSGAEQE